MQIHHTAYYKNTWPVYRNTPHSIQLCENTNFLNPDILHHW